MQKKTRSLFLILGLLLIVLGILCIFLPGLRQKQFGVLEEQMLVPIPVEELPADTFYITSDRRDYPRGEMTLIIPSISVFTAVGESTSPEGLKTMPGLYEFSQLPGEGDINVSIAGHRDIHDMVFYSLDRVQENDYAYLLYDNLIYRYIYRDKKIVSSKEWSVILPQGFSCLTLTTCDPIGTTLNRLIARWELVEYMPYNSAYTFVESSSAGAE